VLCFCRRLAVLPALAKTADFLGGTMKRDELSTGWVRNDSPMNKPDLTHRDSQPTDIEWCPDCKQPMSLCQCDH